jgi:hypothetical protein
MALQATAFVRKWLSSDHVETPTDKNANIAQQQESGVSVRSVLSYYKQHKLLEKENKFHVALHASHAVLQILTFQNFSP